ncbi:MAG: RNA polymerase sigma factor [Myxococcota bacterium]
MTRFAEGEAAALEALFERRADEVHGFLTRMVGDRTLAEDLLQSTFLSVVRSADRYQRGSPVMPWLLTIAGNAARDALRHRSYGVEKDAPELPDVGVEQEPSDPLARKKIEQAFAELPAPQREAVLLHKLHGWSFEQIAQRFGITSTAARIRAHRGYERLRELLGELVS